MKPMKGVMKMNEDRFRTQFTVDFKRHKTNISVLDTEKDLLFELKLNVCIKSHEALNIIELLKRTSDKIKGFRE